MDLPKEMDGKILSLKGSSSIFTDTQRDETNRLIFVKRIPGIITALEFAKIAMDYAIKGPILDIKYRRHTGGDKTAFALVYFQEDEDGKGAIEGLNGRHLEFQGQHRVLSAERASRWTQQVSRTNLYVTNLPGHWTGEDLKSVFDKYGKVMQATVLPHPQIDEQNSGAGFVRFGTEEDAASAMTATDGRPATAGSEKILEVKYAKANIHKNRRNDPLVNAALLKDFRKRKAEFLTPHATKRLRYSAPVMLTPLGGGFRPVTPSYLPLNPLMPMSNIMGLPQTMPGMLPRLTSQHLQGGLFGAHQQNASSYSNALLRQTNSLLQQNMLQPLPVTPLNSQFLPQQPLTSSYRMTQPSSYQVPASTTPFSIQRQVQTNSLTNFPIPTSKIEPIQALPLKKEEPVPVPQISIISGGPRRNPIVKAT